ncbi:putative DNA helicase ino80 [Microbotryomycetes sp. JL201]|nr:putative DNA helicase ino80 [Microbotryomycetes sp. JL201]
MSLAHLLNDPSPSSDGSHEPLFSDAPDNQLALENGTARRPSQAAPNGRRATKRPRKYEDDDGDYEEGGAGSARNTPPAQGPSRHSRSAAALAANGTAHAAAESDDEDDAVVLTQTQHIWHDALSNYILSTHAQRRQLELDFEANELARHFRTAARVSEATTKRMNDMTVMRATRPRHSKPTMSLIPTGKSRPSPRDNSEGPDSLALPTETDELGSETNSTPVVQESKLEARRRKNREAAKRRRDEERARRERGNVDTEELRMARQEDVKSAYMLELERRANMTADEREAQYRAMIEKRSQQEAEEAALLKELEARAMAAGLAEGRGQRKRKPVFGYDQDKISWDDLLDDEASGQQSRHGLASRRSSSAQPADDIVHDNFLGPDGLWYDLDGRQLSGRQGSDFTHVLTFGLSQLNHIYQQSLASRQFFMRRVATVVAREARKATARTKGPKESLVRAKRVMREIIAFSRGNEKRERETRKKAEKEAYDKARREEEAREAKRQARKLNFLITQTELYSHFVGSKIKTSEAEESADTAADIRLAPPEQSASVQAALAATNNVDVDKLKELDFDNDDENNLTQHARRNAEAAVEAAKSAANQFDKDAAAAREAAGGSPPKQAKKSLDLDGDELNFQNPSLPGGEIEVEQPKLLTCQLKEYQLKGLRWLANLYEQGINGILADEMGLGKTVQSIALMAYLAEKHDIWGPFLVIAPASTLHNWQQEITRFTPALKALPYWGNPKDRAVLRKFWNRKSIKYDKNAPYHIVVTSYQLVVQDEKYFQSVRWQYMVLDEAQAIKSANSTRWRTLLGFRCRNRLLLTGTPIQNSMHELWALLHFIMPSLFDSHNEFSEWFSKDIESSAEAKGAMNEHQLRRLHMILKPFMLRRIKKNVQNELSDKIEIDVYCELTTRQRAMYRTLKEHISITDLVARATSLNDDDSVKRLMNLIMQFRKVCNHPELFERADVTAPFSFSAYNRSGSGGRASDVLEVPYAVNSPIQFVVPKLLYRDGGMVKVPNSGSRAGSDTLYLDNLMNIWTADYLHRSLQQNDSAHGWMNVLKLSPSEAAMSVKKPTLVRIGQSLQEQALLQDKHEQDELDDDAGKPGMDLRVLPRSSTLPRGPVWHQLGLVGLSELESHERSTSRLARADIRSYMDKAVAPTIDAFCSDRSFAWDQDRERFDPLFSCALHGLPKSSENDVDDIGRFEAMLPGLPSQGILGASGAAQLPFPPMQVPQLRKLILDSGKLAKLDSLLKELKAGGHRCLIYFQMTRMIDLMEEYLSFRQYKYLRLDGSTTISDRRDMVLDWQTRPDLFIFLLSTRAGGLGINLTAADTVIFYDSDWNPSNDAQAMDRAHRLGQTKQVTVYRFITRNTVDERIVQLARNKKVVQDAVVGSSSVAAEPTTKTSEVMSLLLDDREMEETMRQAELKRQRAEEQKQKLSQMGVKAREEYRAARLQESKIATKPAWELEDDDDGFFSNATGPAAVDDDDTGSGNGGTGAGAAGSKKQRKRAPQTGPDGQPKPKKRRRTKAEMEAARAADAFGPSTGAHPQEESRNNLQEHLACSDKPPKAVPIAITTSRPAPFSSFTEHTQPRLGYAGLGISSQSLVLLPPLPLEPDLDARGFAVGAHASGHGFTDFDHSQAAQRLSSEDRHRIVSAPQVCSTSPRSPLSMSTSSGSSPPRRRSAQFPLSATATTSLLSRTGPASPPKSDGLPSSSLYLSPNSRRRRSSTSLSTSAGSAAPPPPLFGSLVGSFEQSLLSGRLSALPSLPLPFVLSIGVLGGPLSSPSLKCPPHLNLPLGAFYYAGHDSSKLSSPYVGTVDLEAHYMSLLQQQQGEDDHCKRKVPRFPGYQIPGQGQLQLVVKNPNSTAVKLFLIPYDLTGLDRHGRGGKTFLRQKSYTVDDGACDDAKGRLRYAVHLHFCSPPVQSKKQRKDGDVSPRYYLHGNVRVVFASRALDVSEKLRVVTESPDGIVDGSASHNRSGVDDGERFSAYAGPSAEWEIARRKAQERNKIRNLVGRTQNDDHASDPALKSSDDGFWHAQQSRQSTPTHDPDGMQIAASASSSTASTPFRSATPFMPYAEIASVAFAAPFSFQDLSAALPQSGHGVQDKSRSPRLEALTTDGEFQDLPRPLPRSGLATTRPPSREDCGR